MVSWNAPLGPLFPPARVVFHLLLETAILGRETIQLFWGSSAGVGGGKHARGLDAFSNSETDLLLVSPSFLFLQRETCQRQHNIKIKKKKTLIALLLHRLGSVVLPCLILHLLLPQDEGKGEGGTRGNEDGEEGVLDSSEESTLVDGKEEQEAEHAERVNRKGQREGAFGDVRPEQVRGSGDGRDPGILSGEPSGNRREEAVREEDSRDRHGVNGHTVAAKHEVTHFAGLETLGGAGFRGLPDKDQENKDERDEPEDHVRQSQEVGVWGDGHEKVHVDGIEEREHSGQTSGVRVAELLGDLNARGLEVGEEGKDDCRVAKAHAKKLGEVNQSCGEAKDGTSSVPSRLNQDLRNKEKEEDQKKKKKKKR